MDTVKVQSEIGTLNSVILKRPALEIENLTPDYVGDLLFDEIPYLPQMQVEHDYFARILKNRGIEVLYLEELMAEVLRSDAIKEDFLNAVLDESNHLDGYILKKVYEYLMKFTAAEMVAKIMGGVRKDEQGLDISAKKSLLSMVALNYPFYVSPMPNLYFTRDPAAFIGNGVAISKMNKPARRKESLFIKYILENHVRFKDTNIPKWIDRDYRFSIEGGDILVLSKNAIAIGISERTSAVAIEQIARELFAKQKDITKVLAVDIPKKRAFMHLDTVFTMLDKTLFSVHHEIFDSNGEIDSYIIERDDDDSLLNIRPFKSIEAALKETLALDEIELIPCGGTDKIAAAREQWSDGSNTLAIAPGVVVTYDRNYITNKIFRDRGIEVLEIPSSEISRGRGGPRCMSMPLYREDV